MPAPRVDETLVLLRREAIAQGLSDQWLHRRVREGTLMRMRQGIYVDARAYGDATPRLRHRLLAEGVTRLYDDDVALSHVSACLEWGAPDFGLPLDRVHLTDLHAAGERTKARVHHHRGQYLVGEVTRLRSGWISTPARAVVETLPLVDFRAGVCLLDWVRQQNLAGLDELEQQLARLEQWPHHATPSAWLSSSDGLADSVGETLLRLVMAEAGLPIPVAQYPVRDREGNIVYTVDFGLPDYGLIIEFDGDGKYLAGGDSAAAVLREKRRENRIRELTGFLVIRIEWSELRDTGLLVAKLRRALAWQAA